MSAYLCAKTFGLHLIGKLLQFVCCSWYQSSRTTFQPYYLVLQLAFVLLVNKHRLWLLHVNVSRMIKFCTHATLTLTASSWTCQAHCVTRMPQTNCSLPAHGSDYRFDPSARWKSTKAEPFDVTARQRPNTVNRINPNRETRSAKPIQYQRSLTQLASTLTSWQYARIELSLR